MLFPVSRVPIPAICLVLAGFPIMPALWGAFCGFPREYLTPAHVCSLSRIHSGILAFPPSVLLSRFPSQDSPSLSTICPALRSLSWLSCSRDSLREILPASSLLYYWLFNYIFVLNPPKINQSFIKSDKVIFLVTNEL